MRCKFTYRFDSGDRYVACARNVADGTVREAMVFNKGPPNRGGRVLDPLRYGA